MFQVTVLVYCKKSDYPACLSFYICKWIIRPPFGSYVFIYCINILYPAIHQLDYKTIELSSQIYLSMMALGLIHTWLCS